MLRHASVKVWNSTNEICRVSQALSKLLTLQTNSRKYHGPGLIFDEDNDSPVEGRRNPRRQRLSNSTSNEDEYQYKRNNQFRHRNYDDDFQSKRSNRYRDNDYDDEFQSKRSNQYRDRDYDTDNTFYKPRQDRNFGNQNQFSRPSYSRNFNQNFKHGLVKTTFDPKDLPPVEKDFYIEHPDVAQRSVEEVESYRENLNIAVRGTDVPKPITCFDELSLPDSLHQVVSQQEYSEPTPIQAQGWPIALNGRDMVGISQTGSGKTLVFVLPAIIHAKNQPEVAVRREECKPQVLVLAPTRELVQQILQVSERFSHSCGMRSACAYGGASKNYQIRGLKGAHICVATPGRLIDFVSQGLVNLQNCTYLVLDEADRMLDMGFEPQIRQIVSQIRPDRQTLMWSATWPRDIQNLAEEFLTDYVQVTIGAGELVANPKIEQNIYIVQEYDKDERLLTLLERIAVEEQNKVLVFAQTKRKVDFLGRHLSRLGIPVYCIHGDISQYGREQVLQAFRVEKPCVLIATDVAARGLDVSDIEHVVNCDFPPTIEDYIHRIGRTARGDSSGVAHSFFTQENSGVAKDLISVLKQANQEINPDLYSMIEKKSFKSRGNPHSSPRWRNQRSGDSYY